MRIFNEIVLKPGGFYIGDQRVDNFDMYENHILRIDNATLENFFDVIMPKKSYINTYLSGLDLTPFYDELKKPASDKTVIVKLIIEKRKEIWDEDTDIYCDFYGMSNEKDDNAYSLSFTQINNIKHCVLEISDEYKIFDYNKKEFDKSESSDGITLKECIACIIDDISFHGYPSDRDEKRDEVLDVAERIDKGEEKFYTMEEVQLKLYESLMEDYVEEENYEKAAETQKKIEELKSEISKFND